MFTLARYACYYRIKMVTNSIRGNGFALLLTILLTGMLACGTAAPQENELAFTGVTAAPQEDPTDTPDATAEPTSTPTPTPTPTPLPTICLDYQDRAGTLTQICRTKPDNTPGEYYKLASQTLQELAEEYDTEESTKGDSGSRGTRGTEGASSAATGPLVDVIIEVHTEDDLAPVVDLLKSANWPPSYTWDTAVEARIPASLLPRLAKMEGVFNVNEVLLPTPGG